MPFFKDETIREELEQNQSLLIYPHNKNMKKILKYGLNLHLVRASHVQEVGSLLQHFSELLVGHGFSSKGYFTENQKILEPKIGSEKTMVDLLSSIASFMATNLLDDIPIMDIPMLLSPRKSFDGWRSRSLSKREKVPRRGS